MSKKPTPDPVKSVLIPATDVVLCEACAEAHFVDVELIDGKRQGICIRTGEMFEVTERSRPSMGRSMTHAKKGKSKPDRTATKWRRVLFDSSFYDDLCAACVAVGDAKSPLDERAAWERFDDALVAILILVESDCRRAWVRAEA